MDRYARVCKSTLGINKSKGENKHYLVSITLTRDVTSIYYKCCEISLPAGRNRYRIFSILEWNCLLLKNIAENWSDENQSLSVNYVTSLKKLLQYYVQFLKVVWKKSLVCYMLYSNMILYICDTNFFSFIASSKECKTKSYFIATISAYWCMLCNIVCRIEKKNKSFFR